MSCSRWPDLERDTSVPGSTESPLRQHLLLNVKETIKYSTLRQFLVSHEQTTRWTTTDLINSGKDHGEQADRDLSRIKGEEKGGKAKGKRKMSWKGKFGGGKGKEEEKAKDMATTSTKEKEEETTKEERKEGVEEQEEVTKEDSKAKAEDLEVEHPMLIYVIIAIGLVITKPIADRSKETCKAAASGKHSKTISRVLHPLSSCHTSQIPEP